MNQNIKLSLDRVLMDGISDMVFVVKVENNTNFVYEYLNRAAMEGTGMTEDVIGKSIQEVYTNEAGRLLFEYYHEVVTSRKTLIYEDSYLEQSSVRHYSESKLIPLLNENKECIRIVASVKDITDQKRTQLKAKNLMNRLNESKLRYQSLFYHNSDAIFSIDLEGRITNGNNAVKSITGYNSIDLIGSTFYSIVISGDIHVAKDLFLQALGGTAGNSQLAILHQSGQHVIVSLKVTPLMIDENEVIGLYVILRDLTKFIHSSKKLQESEEKFRIIAENATDLISLVDNQGIISYASPSYKNVLGFNPEEYVGKLFLHNVCPNDIKHLNQVILKSIHESKSFTVQFKQYNYQNKLIWCESVGTPVFDKQNKLKHMVVLTRDIHLQKRYERKLKFLAFHDNLTGLPNRLLFEEYFNKTLEGFNETKDGLAVIMLDIDDFKKINDQMGHDVGDQVIAEFGKRITKTIRQNDMVARIGGDEFVILLPKIGSINNASDIAKTVLERIQKPWNINGLSFQVTTSMGIAMASVGMTSSALLKEADIALYEAKEKGKNSYQLQKDHQMKQK